MIKHIKAFFSAPARYGFWLPSGPRKAPRLFMYHSVTDDNAPDGLTISPQHFGEQLADLKQRGYRFLTASQLAERILAGETDHAKIAVITFDDGYEDNYTQAFPLLRQHGVCATIYLSPAYKEITFLSEAQIKEMAASGLIEFGAHTYNHVNLTKVPADVAEAEIVKSKHVAEALSGQACVSFAYPYGRYADEHVQMVRKAGFTNAVTTKKRLRVANPAEIFRLPRMSVDGRMNKLQWRIMLQKGRYKL